MLVRKTEKDYNEPFSLRSGTSGLFYLPIELFMHLSMDDVFLMCHKLEYGIE